jgi:hypothetical protein
MKAYQDFEAIAAAILGVGHLGDSADGRVCRCESTHVIYVADNPEVSHQDSLLVVVVETSEHVFAGLMSRCSSPCLWA